MILTKLASHDTEMDATGLETEDKTLLGTNQRCAFGSLQPNYLSGKGATGIGKTGLSRGGEWGGRQD